MVKQKTKKDTPGRKVSGNFFQEMFLTWKLTSPEFHKNARLTMGMMLLVFIGACWAIATAIKIAPVAGFFKDQDIRIEKKTVSINLVNYEAENFKMRIPDGWIIDTTGRNENSVIYVHDPEDLRYGIFVQLQSKPLMRTYDERNVYQRYANTNQQKYGIYSYAPVIRLGTVETFYGVFNSYAENVQSYLEEYADFHFPVIKEFKKADLHGNTTTLSPEAKDDTSLRATFKTTADAAQFSEETNGEGLFTGTIMSYDPSGVTGYYVVYDTAFITVPEDELITLAPTLLESLSSLKFKNDFAKTVSKRKTWDKKAPDINTLFDESTNNLHRLWEDRNQDYDIARQKWSDEHLNMERACTQDGSKCYRAFRGFNAGYKGKKYRAAEDKDYLKPLAGEIVLKD
ncbi:MAG: hypothetical protein K6F57_01605 [Candidatus Saccharibacteria bacterium]|nr:hypothetical protein [Candidatus Saccharibacteria bacterium]